MKREIEWRRMKHKMCPEWWKFSFSIGLCSCYWHWRVRWTSYPLLSLPSRCRGSTFNERDEIKSSWFQFHSLSPPPTAELYSSYSTESIKDTFYTLDIFFFNWLFMAKWRVSIFNFLFVARKNIFLLIVDDSHYFFFFSSLNSAMDTKHKERYGHVSERVRHSAAILVVFRDSLTWAWA